MTLFAKGADTRRNLNDPPWIMETDTWLEAHKGHNVEEVIREYPLKDGSCMKRVKARKCHTCNVVHAYDILETAELES